MITRQFARPAVAILVAIVFVFNSCDDQISDVGGDVLIGTEVDIIETTITNMSTQQVNTDATRANNLSHHLLGSYSNDNYGCLLYTSDAADD